MINVEASEATDVASMVASSSPLCSPPCAHARPCLHVGSCQYAGLQMHRSADQECLSIHAIEYAAQVFVSTYIRTRMYLVRVRVNERTSIRVCGQERHREWLSEWRVRGSEYDESVCVSE